MSIVYRHSGRALTASQRDWLWVRKYLQLHRDDLGQAAAEGYPDVPKVDSIPLLTRPEWLPTEPILLDSIDLEFAPDLAFT